jgi:hypothetical protein
MVAHYLFCNPACFAAFAAFFAAFLSAIFFSKS